MAVAGYSSSVLLTSPPSVPFTNAGLTDSGDHKTYTITDTTKRYLDKSVATVVQTSPDGTVWTTITTGFTLYRVGARIVFAAAQSPTLQVRLASGNYYVYATLVQAHSCDFSGKMNMIDTTQFNTAGTESWLPGTLSGTFKVGTFWINTNLSKHLTNRDLLICSFVLPSGNRYEGYVYTSDSDFKTDPKSAVTEDLTFQVTDEFFAA